MVPIFYGVNYVEGGLITPTGVEAGFGVERLWDRFQRLECRDSATASPRRYTLDRGAGVTGTIDTLILGAGHNLAGLTVEVESSPDGLAPWTLRGTGAAIAGIYRLALTAFDTRYARLNVLSPGVPPILTEWWLTKGFTITGDDGYLSEQSFADGAVPQSSEQETQSGVVLTAILGPTRWRASYLFSQLTPVNYAAFDTLWRTNLLGGARPFYLEDAGDAAAGTLRFVRWLGGAINFQGLAATVTRRDLSVEIEEYIG